jgi:sugar phosphate isomerase/epimerase
VDVGIFAKTFARPTLEDTLDAVVSHGIRYVQFNMACAGLPSMPDAIPDSLRTRIRDAIRQRKLAVSAVSGTFNMIHPDPQQRRLGLGRLDTLAEACADIETGLITLCTGTRDPGDMWRRHPDNDSDDAWNDLCESMRQAIEIAERNRVTLAIEPEVSNVIDSAAKAKRLLDELGSPRSTYWEMQLY